MNYLRRNFLKKLAAFIAMPSIIPLLGRLKGKRVLKPITNLHNFKKIDIHTHISSDASYLKEVMDHLNLKMFTICNEGLKSDRLKAQIKTAVEICNKFPRYYGWCTTFDLHGIEHPGWANRVIEQLKADFDHDALAVKVWKEIGMQLKDHSGKYILIDDPVFHPIFEFIKENDKTLFMHIGDPPGYWLSAGTDGLPDAWFKEGNGVWNRVGKFRGEVSFDRLMMARDKVLAKYPDMKFVGCHMGNLSFDLDQLALRLEKFPNYAVETSFTLRYFKSQAREKVRDFFNKYQDRILYGSDISGGLVASPYLVDMSKIDIKWTEDEVEKLKIDLLTKYEEDLKYFGTDHEFTQGNYSVRGLALTDEVLNKLYFDNSVAWVKGIDINY
jgi:hypothetical protein